ncbi:MAG TPA: hypothetical protein VFO84_08510 [Dehalococcoidia bacterium]|nr:hypothetical protein [Dehalococcoidia bacterium]
MTIIEQANEVVAELALARVHSANICGCHSCKSSARMMLEWLAETDEESRPAEESIASGAFWQA